LLHRRDYLTIETWTLLQMINKVYSYFNLKKLLKAYSLVHSSKQPSLNLFLAQIVDIVMVIYFVSKQ